MYLATYFLFMIKFFRILFFNLFLITLIYSCSSSSTDDEEIIPPNPVSSQYIIENDSIVEFLQTHFYNYDAFENLTSNESVELVIDTISGDNSSKIALFDQVSTMTVEIADENDEIVAHNLYYIINREGKGSNPTVADSVFVSYKGLTLGNVTFDSRKTPLWLDQTSLVRGFQEFTALLKRGDIISNNNGTYSFDNFGIGIVIMPSGLGYFNNSTGSIPPYSPLIFQINLNTLSTADHDNDGIDSINEDLNNNHLFNDDDTDEDNTPNYFDYDDDGDGVSTRDEWNIYGNGLINDTDSDGIPDYLDSDDDGDGILTKDEYDKDGDGVADDTNEDGKPDYLDKDN